MITIFELVINDVNNVNNVFLVGVTALKLSYNFGNFLNAWICFIF